MNQLPVTLQIISEIRLELQLGQSLATSLEHVLSLKRDSFSVALRLWLIRFAAGQCSNQIKQDLAELTRTASRRNLLICLEKGLKGSPIDQALHDLELEIYFSVENIFERQMQLLPLRLLMPLTLLILPGVGLLLIGPLLEMFRQSF